MASYLRYPHLHGELLTFVAADDVWLAPVTGGRAWRLTDDRVPVRNPRFSPDGATLAWTSARDGHSEVYAVDVAGGAPRRLTWWGSPGTSLLGWAADGRLLVASAAREANLRRQVVHAVDLDGRAERLPYGPAWGLARRDDGAVALSTVGSRPPAHWKRYRGGTAPRLWLDRAGDGRWQRLLPDEPAALVDPLWVDGRLAVTSDLAAGFPAHTDEVANLYVLDVDDPDAAPRQVTHHTAEQGYVRDATTDGHRVVYHALGTLYLLPSLAGQPTPVPVELPGALAGRAPRRLGPTDQLEELRPDHGGDASVVTWRGNAVLLAHRQGPARALQAVPGVRARLARPLGRTGSAVWVSDAEGEDALVVAPLDGTGAARTLASGRLGYVLHLEPDPAGRRVAVVAHDGTVRLVEVADGGDGPVGTVRTVGVSREGEAEQLSFSPDGRWLAWSQPFRIEAQNQLMVADLSRPDLTPQPLTSGRFDDRCPAFTADGRYLAFLSARTFDPSYDSHVFDLGFAAAVRPYLVPLRATDPAPFGPSADGWRISKPEKGDDAPDQPEPPAVEVDVEGFEERLVAFPVPSGRYRSLRAAHEGVLWVAEGEHTPLGAHRAGVEGEPPGDRLERWSFDKRELVQLADAVDDYRVSGDGRRVVLRAGDEVSIRPAGKAVEGDDHELVRVDLERLRFELDPVAEWRQMFDEQGRIMRDHYWRPDLNGVDWSAALARYRPLVERLAGHDDLVDLLWETVAELNTSHAYVQPAAPPGPQDRRLGLLGADLSAAEDGWRIDRILPGESSDPAARSPLRAAGVGAAVGDLVVAVDGRPVDPVFGPATALVGAAERPVELTLQSGAGRRRVVVVPLADEEQLRYQDWVRGREARVRERSGGRLGYLHVPDMMSQGWAQLHRDLHLAVEHEGLVLDVRYNRGGHTSQLVLERVNRRVVGWSMARHAEHPGSYPGLAPRGPVVLVCNEYSGSDGDIVNAAAQAMGVGPVVGLRTWGGVVGIDGRFSLVDGTGVTQPRYAFWLKGKDWGVENYGVDPDVVVPHTPADYDREADADPQLDRAVQIALERLAAAPAEVPPTLPEPRVRPAP